MPTLILSNRYTEDSQRLWRSATELGWDVVRLQNWRLPQETLPDPVVYIESLFAPMIGEQLGLYLSEPPEDWLVKLPYELAGRYVTMSNAGWMKEFLSWKEPFKGPTGLFIKPPNDKSFPAKVYKGDDKFPDYIPDDTKVLVQEVVEWEKEFRCFCLDKKVLTTSIYCRNHQVQKHEDWYSSFPERQEAIEFTERVLGSVEAPRAIVVDVGVIKPRGIKEGGWAVVELNAAWGAGMYGNEPKAVLQVIQACMEPRNVVKYD